MTRPHRYDYKELGQIAKLVEPFLSLQDVNEFLLECDIRLDTVVAPTHPLPTVVREVLIYLNNRVRAHELVAIIGRERPALQPDLARFSPTDE